MTRPRLFILAEIAVIMGGGLLLIWFWAPHLAEAPASKPAYLLVVLAALAYVAFVSPARTHRDPMERHGLGSARTLFLRTDNLRKAACSYGILALGGTAILLGLALVRDASALHRILERPFRIKLILYLFSAMVQQLLFTGFLLVRLQDLLGAPSNAGEPHPLRTRGIVCGAAALVFTAYHFPNPLIMGCAFGFGFWLFWTFHARPHLLLAVLCHAWLGTLLNRVVLAYMRVGPFYWNPDLYVIRTLFPVIQPWMGDLY